MGENAPYYVKLSGALRKVCRVEQRPRARRTNLLARELVRGARPAPRPQVRPRLQRSAFMEYGFEEGNADMAAGVRQAGRPGPLRCRRPRGLWRVRVGDLCAMVDRRPERWYRGRSRPPRWPLWIVSDPKLRSALASELRRGIDGGVQVDPNVDRVRHRRPSAGGAPGGVVLLPADGVAAGGLLATKVVVEPLRATDFFAAGRMVLMAPVTVLEVSGAGGGTLARYRAGGRAARVSMGARYRGCLRQGGSNSASRSAASGCQRLCAQMLCRAEQA